MEQLDLPVPFSEWIKRRRRSLDLTQAELAERTGCSVFALRKIESGERRPSKQLAELLTRSLEIPPGECNYFLKVARGGPNLERLGLADCTPAFRAANLTHPSPQLVHLPAALTPLVDREREMAALNRKLSDPHCRLLTLTGPGGIGKTRLAVEAASRSWYLFPDGVYFVSLAELDSPAFLIPAVAEAMGIPFQGQIEPRLQLLHSLRMKKALLLLDNVEHLIAGLDLLEEILVCAPAVKLLVTSQVWLNLRGEWVFDVRGLPCMLAGESGSMVKSGSLALFLQAAQRVKVGFELKPEDWPFVDRICQSLEGIPLGIELAAAWVLVLSCQEIAQEIERDLDFLATSLRNVPERQRSLRAAFDYSWNLLSDVEREALSRLAVFERGFNREAADRVAGIDLATVLVLVSKSLVSRQGPDHYHLHEVIRHYAFSRLCNDQQNRNYGYRAIPETNPIPGPGRADSGNFTRFTPGPYAGGPF